MRGSSHDCAAPPTPWTSSSASASCVWSSRTSSLATTRSSSGTASPSVRHPRQLAARQLSIVPMAHQAVKVTFCVRGVASPLLANVYLHYLFDLWAERWRRREARGNVIIVRYADDIVVGFEQFSLAFHPDKTRLMEFGRHAAANRMRRGLGKPETFMFLGFIYICGKSRRGAFQLQRKTRGDRMRAKLREIKEQLRERRHEPIPEQGRWLKQVVSGFFAYHAVPTNSRALSAFRHYVTDRWRRTLRRRSQKDGMTWERITKIADAWLPQPRILHPWPEQRFAVRHPRWEPSA